MHPVTDPRCCFRTRLSSFILPQYVTSLARHSRSVSGMISPFIYAHMLLYRGLSRLLTRCFRSLRMNGTWSDDTNTIAWSSTLSRVFLSAFSPTPQSTIARSSSLQWVSDRTMMSARYYIGNTTTVIGLVSPSSVWFSFESSICGSFMCRLSDESCYLHI